MRRRSPVRWAVRAAILGSLAALSVWAYTATASADGTTWTSPPVQAPDEGTTWTSPGTRPDITAPVALAAW